MPCDEAWWARRWRRARDERRAGGGKGGRPRKQPPAGMPTAGERIDSPELTADKVRNALIQVENCVRVIIDGANSAIKLLGERGSEYLDESVEIDPAWEIVEPLLGKAHEAYVYKWRVFKALEFKAKMGELLWPEPDRINHAERALADLHQGVLALLMSLKPVLKAPRSRAKIQHLLSSLPSVAFPLILDLGEFGVELDLDMDAENEN